MTMGYYANFARDSVARLHDNAAIATVLTGIYGALRQQGAAAANRMRRS